MRAARVRSRAQAFVEDGFHLPEAKGGIAWLDADTLLLASAYGGEAWRRAPAMRARCVCGGAAPIRSAAPVLFEIDRGRMAAGAVSTARPGLSASGSSTGSAFLTTRLDRRPHRPAGAARPADRRRLDCQPRLARRENAHRLDGGRQDLCARHLLGGSVADSLPAGIASNAVQAQRARRAAGLLLGGRSAGALDPRQPAPALRLLTPAAGGLGKEPLAGLAGNGRGFGLAAGHGGERVERRSCWSTPRTRSTRPPSACCHRHGARPPEARASGFRRRRPCRDAA